MEAVGEAAREGLIRHRPRREPLVRGRDEEPPAVVPAEGRAGHLGDRKADRLEEAAVRGGDRPVLEREPGGAHVCAERDG